MPIYEFTCNVCGNEFEEILPSSNISTVTCNACGSSDIKKMLSSGSFRLRSGSGSSLSNAPAPACGKSGFS